MASAMRRMDSPARGSACVAARGTVNVFARELKIPLRVERAWEVLQRGREIKIDLPRVEFSANGVFYKNDISASLRARAWTRARSSWWTGSFDKKQVGKLAYVIAGLKALCKKNRKSPCAQTDKARRVN